MAHVPMKIYAKDKELFVRLKALPRKELLGTPVSLVPFCVRAQNGFQKKGVQTLLDLIQKRKMDLLKQQNMGRKTVEQIEAYLNELGLFLGTPRHIAEATFVPLQEVETEVETGGELEEVAPKSSGVQQMKSLLDREQKLNHLAGKMRSLLAEIEEVLR